MYLFDTCTCLHAYTCTCAVTYTVLLNKCTFPRLEYDQASNTYHNQSGIDIKAVGFGVTCRVEYLLASGNEKECGPQIKRSEYLHHFVEYFVKNFGYERDRTIRAAPYDFRMTPGMYARQFNVPVQENLQNKACNACMVAAAQVSMHYTVLSDIHQMNSVLTALQKCFTPLYI